MKIMNIPLGVALISVGLMTGCNSSNNNDRVSTDKQPQVEKFSSLSRAAFAQALASEPLALNNLEIDYDVIADDFYDDLLMDP